MYNQPSLSLVSGILADTEPRAVDHIQRILDQEGGGSSNSGLDALTGPSLE